MKNIFQKFAEQTEYNLDDFYAFRINCGVVRLQGAAKEQVVKRYQSMGFNFEFDADNHWLFANLLNDDLTVEITLTLP